MWCDVCGKARPCSADEAVRYALGGWPVCCGEVMFYGFTEPEPGEARRVTRK